MHHDEGRIVIIYARIGGCHDIALEQWYKRRRVFSRNRALLAKVDVNLLDISYIRCLEEVGYVERLQHLAVLLRSSPTPLDNIRGFKVLYRPYDKLPFLRDLLKWGRDCVSEQRIEPARPPVFAGWQSVGMFTIPLHKRPLLYALATQWSGYECCTERNVSLPPSWRISAFYYKAEAGFHEVDWKIEMSELWSSGLGSLLACGHEGPPARWVDDTQVRNHRAPGVRFQIPRRTLVILTDDVVLRVLNDSFFDLMTARFPFKRFQEVDSSDALFLDDFRLHSPKVWFIGSTFISHRVWSGGQKVMRCGPRHLRIWLSVGC